MQAFHIAYRWDGSLVTHEETVFARNEAEALDLFGHASGQTVIRISQ